MEIKSFDPKLVSLMKEENKLSNEYKALLAGAEIQYDSKTLNLAVFHHTCKIQIER